MPPRFPAVETGEGWELVEESVETLFELPGLTVRGSSHRYEDVATRDALATATGDTVAWTVRFFAATRLGFDPGLPPGTLPSMLLPTIRQEVQRSLKTRLRDRGVESIDRGRSERVRVDGSRVRLRSYEGVVPDADLPVIGWAGVWHDGDDFLVVTGGYPQQRLADAFALEDPAALLTVSPSTYRDDFFEMLDGV